MKEKIGPSKRPGLRIPVSGQRPDRCAPGKKVKKNPPPLLDQTPTNVSEDIVKKEPSTIPLAPASNNEEILSPFGLPILTDELEKEIYKEEPKEEVKQLFKRRNRRKKNKETDDGKE